MSKIFRSRWAALLWAGGILWTAYDVAEAAAPSKHPAAAAAKPAAQPTDASAAGISTDDLAVLSAFVNGN
jgi:hypothetical protein